MAASVDALWDQFETWCRVNAPNSLTGVLAPPLRRDLERVMALFPHPWPPDLQRLYAVQGGSPGHNCAIAPLFSLSSLPEIESTAPMMREIWFGFDDDPHAAMRAESHPAGTVEGCWPESYVPFAGSGAGDWLFVDTRSGVASGCVREFLKVDSDQGMQTWPSVTAMLTDVVDALENVRDVGGWTPGVDNGELVWDP